MLDKAQLELNYEKLGDKEKTNNMMSKEMELLSGFDQINSGLSEWENQLDQLLSTNKDISRQKGNQPKKPFQADPVENAAKVPDAEQKK